MAVHRRGFIRGSHTTAGIDEQLVFKAVAQLLQAVADGGLANKKGLGDLGDAGAFVNRNENQQVLHIQLSEHIAFKHIHIFQKSNVLVEYPAI